MPPVLTNKMRILIMGLLSLLSLSCSKSDLSKSEIKNIVQKHYDQDPFFTNPKIEIKLIKDVPSDYKAILVKIDDTKFSYGFINQHIKKYLTFSEFEKQKNKITESSNWRIQIVKTIDGKMTKESQNFSVFYGIVPYEEFQEIEMSWNCKETEKTELIDGKYFFFVYPQHNMKRCNVITLIDKEGNRKKIEYQQEIENGVLIKNGFILE